MADLYVCRMKTALLRSGTSTGSFFLSLLIIAATALSTRGDQVDMQNGDHYSGKVIALDDDNVVLKSEILGTLRLTRSKVAAISFGDAQPANAPSAAPAQQQLPKGPRVARISAAAAGEHNPNVNLNSSTLRQQIAANPNLVSKVQTEVLAGAGPKAAKKYDDLISGLSTGNINIADLRKEAEAVAAQLKQLRGNEDDESGEIFDEYLSVLDSFLKETKSATPPASAPPVGKPPVRQAFRPAVAPPKTAPNAVIPKDDEE